jgi:hypothetical protein
MMPLPPDFATSTTPLIEFLLLADRAEATNGKLYVMGGGWDRLAPPAPGVPVPLSFAVSILVPWNATNRDYTLSVFVEDTDGERLDFKADATLNTGRPPNAIQGQPLRVMIAIPMVLLPFPKKGRYEAKAAINGEEMASATFTVQFQSPEQHQ